MSSVERGTDNELVVVEIKFGSQHYVITVIHEFRIHISTSIHYFDSFPPYAAETRLFRLFLLNGYMVPSNVLHHPTESPGLFSRPRNTLHCQQSLSTDQGKCHPMQSQTSSIDHISQMHHPQPFDLPGWLNCPFMRGSTNSSFLTGIDYPLFVLHCTCSISPHNSESRIDGLVPTHRAQIQHEPLLSLSVFGALNVLPRGLLG